jgi:hypothetical protein
VKFRSRSILNSSSTSHVTFYNLTIERTNSCSFPRKVQKITHAENPSHQINSIWLDSDQGGIAQPIPPLDSALISISQKASFPQGYVRYRVTSALDFRFLSIPLETPSPVLRYPVLRFVELRESLAQPHHERKGEATISTSYHAVHNTLEDWRSNDHNNSASISHGLQHRYYIIYFTP